MRERTLNLAQTGWGREGNNVPSVKAATAVLPRHMFGHVRTVLISAALFPLQTGKQKEGMQWVKHHQSPPSCRAKALGIPSPGPK